MTQEMFKVNRIIFHELSDEQIIRDEVISNTPNDKIVYTTLALDVENIRVPLYKCNTDNKLQSIYDLLACLRYQAKNTEYEEVADVYILLYDAGSYMGIMTKSHYME